MEFESFVLAAATHDLTTEPAAREHADAIEFRMDLAENPLDTLAAYGGVLPVIATNRADWEGGEADTGTNETARIDALRTATEHPKVKAVDIELRALADSNGTAPTRDAATLTDHAASLTEHARANAASVIVSIHDFETTPERDRLRDLLVSACEYGDVGKLAVTAHDAGDVLDLLTVTHELAVEGRWVATMAMGAPGKHSRVVAPLYGSKIGYAPLDSGDATAPGQYDLATFAELIERLR